MIEKRYEELIKIINEADYNYHTLDKPTITDQEYDKYLRELFDLEYTHPEIKRADSPTQRAGGKVLDGFEKVTHKIPMLSLSNVFNESEIINFDERIKKEGINPKYVCELKIDGLSVSLQYEKGKLVKAATRGDGVVGEDITNNVKTIKTVPLTISKEIDIEVRGEIYMSKDVFNKINENEKTEDSTTESLNSNIRHRETARGAWECVKCDTVNKEGTDRCSNCGSDYSPFTNPTVNPYEKKKVSRWIKEK